MRRVALRNSLKLDKLLYKLSLKGRIPLQGRLFNKGPQQTVLRNHCAHKFANWSRASSGLQQIPVAGRKERRVSCRSMTLRPVYSPLIALA